MAFDIIPSYPAPGYWADFALMFKQGWAPDDGTQSADRTSLFESAVLPPTHWVYHAVQSYALRSLEAKKMSAPQGEETRMRHARQRLDNAKAAFVKAEQEINAALSLKDDTKASLQIDEKEHQKKIMDAAEFRLREKEKGSGVKAPGHRAIAIRTIRLLKNPGSWNLFCHLRMLMHQKVQDMGTNAYRKGNKEFVWCVGPPTASSQKDLENAPLLNADLGESLLFSGTSLQIIKNYIAAQGFDPLFPQPRNKDAIERAKKANTRPPKPDYGMLGQGTYFTDSLALAMCYSTCAICGDFECPCRTPAGRKTVRTVTAARVLLGNPRMYATFGQKFVSGPIQKKVTGMEPKAKEFRSYEAHNNPNQFFEFLESEYQSAFAQGFHGLKTMFSAGSTCNQFLIRHKAQAYLEFCIDFVIGPDSTPFSEALRGKLRDYTKQISGVRGLFTQQSNQSLECHAVLTLMVNVFDHIQPTDKVLTEAQLKQAVRFFLGRGDSPQGLSKTAWSRLQKLKKDGRLTTILSSLSGI